MSASPSRGQFVWQDLMTTDPQAAIQFYSKVVGWGTSKFEGGSEPYTMWMVGESGVGGVMGMPPGSGGGPPNWLSYISTPDTDATVAQVEKLGGKVHVAPRDIPMVGRFAVVQDPQGAFFAPFTPQGDEPLGSPTIGGFSWYELGTTDSVAAFDFYSKVFGWQKADAMDMGPAGTYQMFKAGGNPIGGMYNKAADHGLPAWLSYISVDDIKAAEGRVKDAGGQVVQPPMEVPGGGWILVGLDPQGATFALHSQAPQ